jgi:hypothetical protein
VTTGPVPATGLANVGLDGYAASGSDAIQVVAGGEIFTYQAPTSVLGLSQQWNQAEFNVFGDLNGSEACFNSGSSITGHLFMEYSPATLAAPTCLGPGAGAGTTGEFNNLNPSGSCTQSAGTVGNNGSSIQFTENGAQTCQPGWGDYWPVPMQSTDNNDLFIATINDGSFNENLQIASGTVPSLVALPAAQSNDLIIAFQGTNGDLWYEETTYNGGGWYYYTDSEWKMGAGTSPSIAANSSGVPVMAFQGSNGDLWISQNYTSTDQGLAMAAGTSPAIAILSDGQIVTAYENSANVFCIQQNGTNYNFGLGIRAGTSPSISVDLNGTYGKASGNGYAVAYQSNTGSLEVVTVGSPPTNGTLYYTLYSEGLAMQAGTSPSVAYPALGTTAPPQFAFHGIGGDLWVGRSDQGFAMAAGASPTILPLAGSGGYQVAFEASSTALEIEVNIDGPTEVNTGFAMNTP